MHAAGICLGTIQARTHVQLALACPTVYDSCSDYDLPCSMCMVIVGIWVTNALIMLLPLAFLGSSLATMSPSVGFDTTLTPLNVSMGATASVKLLNDFSTVEQTLRHHTRTGFSIGSSHRVLCVQCAPFVCSCLVSHSLSAFYFCSLWIIAFPTSDASTFFIRVYCIEY